MTREDAKKAAEIMLAYAEGKEVGFYKGNGNWCPLEEPAFNWNNYLGNYKVREAPHYRPFNNEIEVLNAIKEHGLFISHIDNPKDFITIAGVSPKGVLISGQEDTPYRFAYLFDNYIFSDNKPFGVECK